MLLKDSIMLHSMSLWKLSKLSFCIFCMIWTEVRMQTCTKINSCACSYGQDQTVDLSPLQGDPKWADQYDPQYVNMYSYNPCKGFDEGTCSNVAICQYNGADYYQCGTQDSALFTNDPTTGALAIQYQQTDSSGFTRTSLITLECIQSGADSFAVQGETSPGTYAFVLSSVHCCPKAGPPSGGGGSSDGLSIGSILAIAFFAVIFVYFAAGIVVQKYVRKMSGHELLPNSTFWTAIPGLVKEGTLFVVRRGKRQGYSDV